MAAHQSAGTSDMPQGCVVPSTAGADEWQPLAERHKHYQRLLRVVAPRFLKIEQLLSCDKLD